MKLVSPRENITYRMRIGKKKKEDRPLHTRGSINFDGGVQFEYIFNGTRIKLRIKPQMKIRIRGEIEGGAGGRKKDGGI